MTKQFWVTVILAVVLCGCDKLVQQNRGGGNGGDAAASSPPGPTYYRRLVSQPDITISNLSFSGGGTREQMLFDWQSQTGDVNSSLTVIVIPQEGDVMEVSVGVPFQSSGTIEAEFTAIGFGVDTGPSLASGCQVFVIQRDGGNTFQISNSLTSGSFSRAVTLIEPTAEMKAVAEQQLANQQANEAAMRGEMQPFNNTFDTPQEQINAGQQQLEEARERARQAREQMEQNLQRPPFGPNGAP